MTKEEAYIRERKAMLNRERVRRFRARQKEKQQLSTPKYENFSVEAVEVFKDHV